MNKDLILGVTSRKAMFLTIVFRTIGIKSGRFFNGALFGIPRIFAFLIVRVTELVVNIVLRAFGVNMGLVESSAFGIEHFVMSASERSTIMVQVLMLMLVRVVEGQIRVFVYVFLHGGVVAMVGDVVVSASALTSLSVAINGVGWLSDDVLGKGVFGADVVLIRGHACLLSLLVSVV